MPKFIITTLGCKVNQCESESIVKSMITSGWTESEKATGANVCIINTCTVTRKASMQSRQAIRKAIRSNPGALVVVTGCYAQTEPDELRKIEGIGLIIGNSEKENIFELIQNKFQHSDKCIESMSASLARPRARTRAFLKIQDGCESFCTYCIVPYARGRSRSMPVQSVIESVNNLRKVGYSEVVLSGIHLGKYGHDLSPETTLTALLELINDSCIIDRVRLSSIEPNELNPAIIKLAAESDKICRHFHIPLQSGDDGILKKMHRPYSSQYFKDLIIRIKGSIPDAAIGVDILAGFPGETDEAFRNTYSLIDELPVSYLHIFPFSPRKKTPAYEFPEQVSIATIKARCNQMRKLGASKKAGFYQKAVGTYAEILIEDKRDKKTGLLKGISSNYLSILVNGNDNIKNKIIKVRIDKAYDNHATGHTETGKIQVAPSAVLI